MAGTEGGLEGDDCGPPVMRAAGGSGAVGDGTGARAGGVFTDTGSGAATFRENLGWGTVPAGRGPGMIGREIVGRTDEVWTISDDASESGS